MAVIKLSKYLTHGDEEITEIELREPTVEDIVDLDDPYVLLVNDKETAIKVNNKTILKYISRLSALPPSVLKDLTRDDFGKLKAVVMNFLGEEPQMSPVSLDPPTLPTAPLKSPVSLT